MDSGAQARQLEPLTSAVLDGLLEGCQVIGPDLTYLYVNPVAAQHGRTQVDRLIGRKMTEAFPGIEHTRVFASIVRCLNERIASRLENDFEYSDGTHGWFELRIEPVAAGAMVLSIDVSERKRTEEALRRAHRALTTLSECNQALVHASDERVVLQNLCDIAVRKSGYRMAWVGLRQDDATLRSVASAGERESSWSDSPQSRGPIDRALRTGKLVVTRLSDPEPGLEAWRTAASEQGFASSVALPFQIGGATAGALCIHATELDAFDVQELELLAELASDLGRGLETMRERQVRLRAEQDAASLNRRLTLTLHELEDSEDRYRGLVENLEDIVFSVDAEGCFTYVSPSVQRYGYLISEVLGQPFARFVHEADQAALAEGLRRALAGKVEAQVFRARDRQGRERVVRMSARAITHAGASADSAPGVSGVLIDITELKHAEEQLRVAQKMEAIGQLAGGIAHDFNNLLAVILSYAGFVSDEVRDREAVLADVEEIRKAGSRAASLTRQLLAFSRKQVLAPQVLNLNRLATELERMLQRVIGEDIDLVQALAADLAPVKADPGQIEQVIMNLVVNARDAMPKGGKLTIETANVVLDEDHAARHPAGRRGPAVMLAISDTGCGMDEATKRRIFEPFFTTKPVGHGTGLGLPTVYGIIEQSGGSIYVYSEPGMGTTFKIFLPRAHELDTTPIVRESLRAPVGSETILLVEDDQAVRALAVRILSTAGYRVLSAHDGPEAIRLCQQHAGEIDLLVTDVVMPQMSGRELAEHLTGTKPGLRVLYMSGYTDNAIERHGVLEPGTLFIAKPFAAIELARKVRDALDAEPVAVPAR